MSVWQKIRQYWAVVVVTGAVILGLPSLTGHIDSRPGLAGITGRSLDSGADELLTEPSKHAGYARQPGMPPIYGFDGVTLDTPIFPSWWDGKPVVAAAKLRELGSNAVVLPQIWKDSLTFHDIIARMHGAGIKVIIQVTDMSDWVDVRDDAQGRLQPVPFSFYPARAARVLAEAQHQGVGTFADFILIGGDVMTYASQLQRQKIYQVAKQYFPDKPIVLRYGLDLDRAESLLGRPHPMGGTWSDYRFSADECDIALVGVSRGVEEGSAGVRMKVVLEQLNHIVSIVKSRHNDAGIIVATQLCDERLLGNNKTAMWSTREIDQFVGAILTSAAVDGLLIKGLGLYRFDLGNPDFTLQRLAFRDAAPHLSPDEALARDSDIDRHVPGARAPASGKKGGFFGTLFEHPAF